MKQQRIYIDTSIVGGFFDTEFEKETKLLFKRLEKKEVIFVVSTVLGQELNDAPEHVKTLLQKYDKCCFEEIEMTAEAKRLANRYISEKVVGKISFEDCCHIALATIHKVDVLASWNFKHIVNWERIKGYNAVNLKNGYTTVEIRDPRHLIYDYGKDI